MSTTLSHQIKEARASKGLTQEALADMSNVSLRTIQRIELGQVQPRSSTLKLLAEILDIKLPSIAATKETPGRSIKLLKAMNLFIILSIAIPLGNVLVALTFLGIFTKSKLPSAPVKHMLSFQILWSVVTAFLFFLGVFLSNLITKNAGNGMYIGLIIYVLCVIYNMYVVLKSTSEVSKGTLSLNAFIPNFF